jgi:hypothetical protein
MARRRDSGVDSSTATGSVMHPGALFGPTQIESARADRRKRRSRIRLLTDRQPSERRSLLLNRERHAYIRSPSIRRAILASEPQYHHWDNALLAELVEAINPLVQCNADVLWRADPKKTGGERPICCKLPAQVHVGGVIAKDLGSAQLRPDPRVFDWSGRGRHRYANSLAQSIIREGPFVAVADIKSCYQSIDPEALYRLDFLPTELIRWSLDYRNLSFRRVDGCHAVACHASDGNPTGPRGLLQGGPASSVLLTALIGDCVTEVRQAYCQSYADNFAVIGATAAVVQQAIGELVRIVAGLRVGRLEFHKPETFDARDGFDHLGFHFRLVEEHVRISPNMCNSERMMMRIEQRIISADEATLVAGPKEFIREEEAAFVIMPDMDLDQIEEAVEQVWREEVHRRSAPS